MRQLQKFALRKNFALALTKKKEVLYWGDLLEQPKSESLQFINTLTAEEREVDNEYGFGEEEPIQRQKQMLSKRISAFKSIKIIDIACNDFIAHFLAEDGRLYSLGRDIKKYGLLGLGATYEVQQMPVLNSSLVDFRISKITVGLSHCCALTTSGQLYSWGTGQNGQLCQPDDTMFSNVPKQVVNSKQMNIKEVICSSYYTLILSTNGKLTIFGTLKGFAKFLFDSPTKETVKHPDSFSNSRLSERISNKQRLDLGDQQLVSSVCIAERSFACYCENTQNLYFVGENFEAELVMHRELKSFQFLNGHKYIVAHDISKFHLVTVLDNILLVLTQKPTSPQSSFTLSNQQSSPISQKEAINDKQSWQVIKEFNLIQRFNTADVELLAQDTQIGTKKAQNMQLLMFITQSYSKQLMNTFNKKYYKTFLTGNQLQQQQNGYETENSTISDSQWFANKALKPKQCQSPYASFGSSIYEGGTSRHRLKMKIDSMFGSTFSARKNGRNSSTSLKERAKKLHQSLSPVQRFPIINNLCEIIKQQKLQKGSPSKAEHPFINLQNLNTNMTDQMKSPQYNLFLKSLNLACQITNMGVNESQLQSAKQVQFLSKAEKIRQDLNKNQTLNLSKQQSLQQIDGCRQIQQQNSMCNQGEVSQDKTVEVIEEVKKDHLNMPLQLSTAKLQQHHNLSCIMEDGETSTVMQSHRKVMIENSIQTKGLPKINKRQGSVNIPDYPHKLLDSQIKKKSDMPNDMLNIDTISEITLNGRESMHRFSQGGSEFTNNNINSYKILIMNTRAVIEKKLLQCLMMGFMSIKYHQNSNNASSFQSFQLQTTFNQSQPMIDATHICHVDKASQSLLTLIESHQKYEVIKKLKKMMQDSKNKHKGIKKLINVVKQKQEQNLNDSIRKIQISVRFMKLQRLNINLLFNSLSKILKHSAKLEKKQVFFMIANQSHQNLQMQTLQRLNKIIEGKVQHLCIQKWSIVANYRLRFFKGFKKLRRLNKQIDSRVHFSKKVKALKAFKQNLDQINHKRAIILSNISLKIQLRQGYKKWSSIFNEQKLFEKLQLQIQSQERVLHVETRSLQEVRFAKNTPQAKIMCEKSIQGEESQSSNLDIEESQLEPVISPKQQYQAIQQIVKKDKTEQNQKQQFDLQKLLTKGEISFEKHELGEHFLSLDGINMTAHFNKFGLLMSNNGKENQITDFTDGLIPRPIYHNHLMQDDVPDTYTLEPQFNTRNSISTGAHSRQQSSQNIPSGKTPKRNIKNDKSANKENLSMHSKLKLSIQNEISPTNNCKNYQRQTQINKQYEQAEPFELPMTDTDIPVYTQNIPDEYAKFMDKYFDPQLAAQQQQIGNSQPRYSFKNVVPFNPSEDTPMDMQLRQKLNSKKSKDMPMPQHVFESKKQSNASSQASNAQQKQSGFINNYFKQLSAQNSAARQDHSVQASIFQEQQKLNSQNYVLQQLNTQQQPVVQQQLPSKHQLQHQQYSTSTHSNLKQPNSSASFVTNNQNIDLMHFNSHSDNSFVFFDGKYFNDNLTIDNFWRDSGISSVSRVISPNSQTRQANHSFGQQQANPIFMSNLLKQAYLQKRQQEHMPH